MPTDLLTGYESSPGTPSGAPVIDPDRSSGRGRLPDRLVEDHALVALVDAGAGAAALPNGGEEVRAGSIQTLTWTSSGTLVNVKIEFSLDSGANWGTLVASTPNAGTYTGLIPAESPASDQCLVRVSDAIDGCPKDTSDSTFTLLAALPINVVSPFGGETYNVGNVMTIGWTTSGITGDVRIILRRADGSDGYVLEAAYPYNGAPYYYTIPDTVVPSSYFIRVKQGEIISESNNFVIDPGITP